MRRKSLDIFPFVAAAFFCGAFLGSSAPGQTPPLPQGVADSETATPCSKQNEGSHDPPVSLSSGQLTKRVIKKLPIERPGTLGKNRMRGVVQIQVLIDEAGKVTCAYGVKGHPLGIAAAVRSLRGWVFKPYKIEGQPKTVTGLLAIRYDFGS